MNLEGIRAVPGLESVLETAPVRRKASTASGDASAVDVTDDADSRASASFQSVLSAARATPSVRADRVAALRAAIADGTYHIPLDKVVQGLVGESD